MLKKEVNKKKELRNINHKTLLPCFFVCVVRFICCAKEYDLYWKSINSTNENKKVELCTDINAYKTKITKNRENTLYVYWTPWPISLHFKSKKLQNLFVDCCNKKKCSCYSMTQITSTAPNSNTELTLSDNKDFVIYLLIR